MQTLDTLIPKLWGQAVKETERAMKNQKRLKRFSLRARLFLYPRFNFIRKRISLHRQASFFFATMALGGARKLRQIKRKKERQNDQ